MTIVRDAAPNEDGEWIIRLVTYSRWARINVSSSWLVAEDMLARYVPEGRHMVAYEFT